MNKIAEVLFDLLDKQEREKRERRLREAQFEFEYELKQRGQEAFTRRSGIRPATAADYAAWLSGFIKCGGKPTHMYDHDLEKRSRIVTGGDPVNGFEFVESNHTDWYVAESGEHFLPPLHGALSIHVIVQPSATVHVVSAHSHNRVYFMSGYTTNDDFVPVYRDVVRVLAEYDSK